jgi:hypothetical protein
MSAAPRGIRSKKSSLSPKGTPLTVYIVIPPAKIVSCEFRRRPHIRNHIIPRWGYRRL